MVKEVNKNIKFFQFSIPQKRNKSRFFEKMQKKIKKVLDKRL